MKNRFVCLTCILVLCLTGCASSEYRTGLALETYVEEDEGYEYLTDASFRNGKEFLKLPVLTDSDAIDDEAIGETSGVALTIRMHPEEDNSLGSLMSDGYWNLKNTIEGDGGVFAEDPIYIEGDNYHILQQSFNKTVDNLTYPCLLIIKFDTLSMGGFVETDIVVDNTVADETSHAVLMEILDAYGISMSESQ